MMFAGKASSARSANPDLIDGVSAVAADYDAFILDIWGVLHDGIRPFPGTIDCLTRLKSAGKSVLLLSNTPDRRASIARQLGFLGITGDMYDDIVTAGDSAFADIETRQGQVCWYAGDDGEIRLTEGLDVVVQDSPDNADFIVNVLFDLSEAEQRETYMQFETARERNLPMICANPDLVVNVGTALKTCPGTYAAHYEAMGGTVHYHGKPHRPIYELGWQRLGKPDKGRILAIGDSLHTDIQGANGFGIKSVMNLAGIHWEELQCDHAPGSPDREKIAAMISAQPHRPDAVMAGFRW